MKRENENSVEFLIKAISEDEIFEEFNDSADFLIGAIFTDEVFRNFIKGREYKLDSIEIGNKKSEKIIKNEFADAFLEALHETLNIQSREALSKKVRIVLIEIMLLEVKFTIEEKVKMEDELKNLKNDLDKLEKGYAMIIDVRKKLHKAFIGDSF